MAVTEVAETVRITGAATARQVHRRLSGSHVSETSHLLRRTSFAPSLAVAEQLDGVGWDVAIRRLVDEAAPPRVPDGVQFANIKGASENDDFGLLVATELRRLADPASGLGDRMLWFWHGVLTTGFEQVYAPPLLLRQHQTLARHALGSFRQMLIDITTDPAMLIYLSGDGSSGDAPNENYSRELLELFTLGRGNYQQTDVVAGAKALAGWYVDGIPDLDGPWDPSKVAAKFNLDAAFVGTVTYLGATDAYNVEKVIDRILAQSACAEFVAAKVFRHFVHPAPGRDAVVDLASVFRDSGYQIRPLLEATFRRPEMRASQARLARARFPMETLLASLQVTSGTLDGFDFMTFLDRSGQMPFDPPNVAGWPLSNRWIAPTATLGRTHLGAAAFQLADAAPSVAALAAAPDPVEAVLARALLFDASAATRTGLAQLAASVTNPNDRARALLAAVIASPEFALC